MKNVINIAFAVNDKYAEHLGVVLYSILKYNLRHEFAFFVLSGDITADSKKTIKLLEKKFNNFSIKFIKPNNSMFERMPINIDHITRETYYRYVLPELLPRVDKILYFDVDLLVLGDIYELWDIDIKGSCIYGADDNFIAFGAEEFYDDTLFANYKQSIGLSDDAPYINAGVLLMNLKRMREFDSVDKLFENTKSLQGKIKFQDQDVINITFQGEIKKFSNIYNFTERDMLLKSYPLKDVRITHFNGPSKPWHKDRYAPNFAKILNEKYLEHEDEYRLIIKNAKLASGVKTKYALYSYVTDNIGDEIQSLAARRFLPTVDYFIDRDKISDFQVPNGEEVKIIMNGWYSHNPESFPPESVGLKPLLISMYVSDHVKDRLMSDRSRFFYKKYGPVGARNTDTKDYFESNGVDSYFSGCLTLTIQKSPGVKKRNFILAVDLSNEALAALKSQTNIPVIDVAAFATTDKMSTEERFALAEYYLYLYQSAHCVVTTRLHATLPSLALETPVLNIEKTNHEPGRFAGLRELAYHVTESEYVANPSVYDVNTPPENPRRYLALRNELIELCRAYTGYVNDDGYLSLPLDDFLVNPLLLQSLMNGLRGGYEIGYVAKVLNGKVDMVNTGVREANDIQVVTEKLSAATKEISELKSSRAWKMLSKARLLKDAVRKGLKK